MDKIGRGPPPYNRVKKRRPSSVRPCAVQGRLCIDWFLAADLADQL